MSTIKTIKIKTGYWDVAADLHFPPAFNEKQKYPAIVSAHPIGSCKEQTAGKASPISIPSARWRRCASSALLKRAAKR